MYKIAVLGDRDSVLGFRALGLDTFFVEDTEEARHTLHRLARENYAIIYMTEALAGPLAADIDRYKSEATPAVILMTDGQSSDYSVEFERGLPEYGFIVPIFSITFGDADPEQLEGLAALTDARVFDGTENLTEAFRSVKGYN